MFSGFILIFTALTAVALPLVPLEAPTSPIHSANFERAEEGLRNLQLPLNHLAASPKIEFVGPNGNVLDYCSSSLVSDNGTLLTSGHCVEECLRSANALKTIDGISAVDRTRLSDVRCMVRINGHTSPAEVLASNDCRGADRFKNGTARISCDGLDYAILKVNNPTLAKAPCVHVSARVPEAGTEVSVIGFPGQTIRRSVKRDAKDSDGKGAFVTSGQTIPFQAKCYMDVDPPRPGEKGEKPKDWNFSSPERDAVLRRQVGAGTLLQTTTDVLPGVSGGGLVDHASGAIVGVARSYVLNNSVAECRGSSFYTSTAGIVKALRADFPQLKLKELFRCQQNAFTPQNETLPQNSAPARDYSPGAPAVTR